MAAIGGGQRIPCLQLTDVPIQIWNHTFEADAAEMQKPLRPRVRQPYLDIRFGFDGGQDATYSGAEPCAGTAVALVMTVCGSASALSA